MMNGSCFGVHHLHLLCATIALSVFGMMNFVEGQTRAELVDVGVIVDLGDGLSGMVGKMSKTSISMAISDFYLLHNNTTAKIMPHFRNSTSDIVEAASDVLLNNTGAPFRLRNDFLQNMAINLMKNVEVKAIIGPLRSTQAAFVIDIGNKSNVPIISPATSPSLSPIEYPYFIRAAQNSSSQARPIAAVLKAFGWREVVFIYENSEFGRGVIPHLTDAMLEVNAQVKYRSVLAPLASDDQLLQELYKLMTMQTRVFVVHLLPSLASRLFVKANEAGMMKKGYAWIITDVATSLLHSLSDHDISSMQGVIGLKPYFPRSNKLSNFTKRWKKKFREENPNVDRVELDMFGIWAYDSAFALAMALERVGVVTIQQNKKYLRTVQNSLTDLAAIGTSGLGPMLVPLIRNIRFKGLTGDFHIVDGQLKELPYEIVNVIGKGDRRVGFWSREHGISSKMEWTTVQEQEYTTNKNNLGAIIWPGETHDIPRGWDIPTNEYKLKVGVPVKGGFEEFIKVERDNVTKQVTVNGFCVEVFNNVMKALPYVVPYEFVPFEKPDGNSAGSYNDLVYQIYLEKFDLVVGDITIIANRSRYVDFTMPYTESGVRLIVPITNDRKKDAWIFMEPLEVRLWITTAGFFIFTGFVVWVLEHRVNKEFRGAPHKQMGMMMYFAFSMLVFAHKEKVRSNLTRFVVIVWVFVVLVLTSSYTASLTSMLTVQKLRPEFNDVKDLVRNGENIGYQEDSFVLGMLKDMKFDETRIKNYRTFQQYDDALSRGTKNGGVAAILDEIPYLRLFLSNTKYCTKYTMVGPTYRTAGFGFALPKGSPLVPEISRAVLQVTEEKVGEISNQWLGKEADCAEQSGSVVSSDRLKLDSFKGLFLIAGVSSSAALIVFILNFIYEIQGILASEDSVWNKLSAIARTFDEAKDVGPDASRKPEAEAVPGNEEGNGNGNDNENNGVNSGMTCPVSPAVSVSLEADGVFGQEEGFSGTPVHETIITTPEITEITER